MGETGSLRDMEPLFRSIIEGGGVFTLHPRGASMRPTIVPGRDAASIVRLEGRAERYDILFYQRADGSFVLHRVVEVGEQDYTLCGDYQVEFERGVTDAQIIGVVQAIHRPSGDLVRGTPAFVAAGRARRRSLPLRRLWHHLLKVKRLFGRKQ